MSAFLGNRGVRIAIWLGLGAAFTSVAPAACLFPDYTFNDREPSGSGAANAGGGATTTTGPEDCSGDDRACVPEVPEGWTGHFALYDGEPGADPGCPADFPSTSQPPFVGNRDIVAPPAACTCSCGPAQNQTCAKLDTLFISVTDAACGDAGICSGELSVPTNWSGACVSPEAYAGNLLTCGPTVVSSCSANTGDPCNVSVSVSPLAASGGQCAPATVRVQKPDLQWGGLGRACAADGTAKADGCNLGQICLPKPSAPFVGGVCISKDGDNPCPAGAYTSKHLYFAGVADGRGCTNDCACGAPSGGACPTTVSIFSDTAPGCASRIAQLPAGSCAPLTGNPSVAGHSATPPGPAAGGTCAPNGGSPTGNARGDKPRTFCCLP